MSIDIFAIYNWSFKLEFKESISESPFECYLILVS